MLELAVIRESDQIADDDINKMIPAFAEQWNDHLVNVWGVEPANFTLFPTGQAPPPSSWWVLFLNDSDQADALAYHDLTNDGLPISKVFVKTIMSDGSMLSVGATHELCEMAVDPWLNGAFQDGNGVFWAGEICDPVEDDRYAYQTSNGVYVTDFVTPNWFTQQKAMGPVDFKGHANSPFEVLAAGYAQKYDPKRGWVQMNGAAAKSARRADPIHGSRRDRRARLSKGLRRSERSW